MVNFVYQFLKNPGMYKSVSAFAPIANPINCPWGQKAFEGYFGEDQQQKWKEHDATELVKQWKGPLEILIDVVRISRVYYCAEIKWLTTTRALETTSTSNSNCYPRTLLRQPRALAMIKESSSACSPAMTTAITLWLRLLMNM